MVLFKSIKLFLGSMNTKDQCKVVLLSIMCFNFFIFCQNGSVVLVENQSNPSMVTESSPTTDNPTNVQNYPGCQTFSNGVCQQCFDGYYLDNQQICRQIDTNCRQFNRQTAICEDCYQGYVVIDGKCSKSQQNTTDSGCRKFGPNNTCTQCSKRWYLDIDGKCKKVDDNCRTWNDQGQCLSCYSGYDLNQGRCILKTNTQNVTDPLCKTWKDSTCVQCSTRAFFNKNSLCQEVNTNCKTWDKLDGRCLSCYQGFSLENSDCIQTNQTNMVDPLCKKYDWQKKICMECAERSFKNQQGVCTEVPPECKTSNQLNCTSCYGGYELKNGKCVANNLSQSTNNQSLDPGCARWDWPNRKCLQCSTRYYFNAQGVCTQVSDTCNTYNSVTGACLSCYSGYALNGTTCVISERNNTNPSNNTTPSDPNCKNYDKQSNRCLQCSYRFYSGINGVCAQVSDQCQTWNYNNGSCTSCYQGYQLSQGACILGDNSNAQDPNCARYDQTQTRCIHCSNRYYFNQNGVCTAVSPQCQTWSTTNGLCTSCYQGYTLANGVCSASQQNNTIPEGCSSYNSQTNICQSCDQNYCLTQNNLCVPKPQNCQTCEYGGGCARCNAGFQLSNGQCISGANSNCLQFQGNTCVQCRQNYFLYNGTCLSYAEVIRILNLYYTGNSGNSGSSGPGSSNTDNQSDQQNSENLVNTTQQQTILQP